MMIEKPARDPRTFGQFLKSKRMVAGKTLREFCFANGYDPRNLSKIERGLLPPPQARETLDDCARALGLREGTAAWFHFFDLAAAESGRFPERLSDDKLIGKLPFIIGSPRADRPCDEQLDWLSERLRWE